MANDTEAQKKKRARALAYHHAHKDEPEYRAKRKQYYENRKSKHAGESRQYYWDHREERLAYARTRSFESRRAKALKCIYGVSVERYETLLAEQNGCCAICEKPETATRNGKLKFLCIDHDHLTGKIRGLLCAACNQAIGLLKDEVRLLTRASHYLEAHRLTT